MRASSLTSAANALSMGATLLSRTGRAGRPAIPDRLLGAVVVDRLDGPASPPRPVPACVLRGRRCTTRTAGRRCRPRRHRPPRRSGGAAGRGPGRRSPSGTVIKKERCDPGTASRSRRVSASDGSGARRGLSIGSTRWSPSWDAQPPSGPWPAVCTGRRGLPGRAPGHGPLTRRPSARPFVFGDSQPMTLPMSRGVVAPVAVIASATSAAISASSSCSAGIPSGSRSPPLPSRRGPPAALPERLDRIAACLDLAGQDRLRSRRRNRRVGRASRRLGGFRAIRRMSRRNASPDRIAAVMSACIRSRRFTGIGHLRAGPPEAH